MLPRETLRLAPAFATTPGNRFQMSLNSTAESLVGSPALVMCEIAFSSPGSAGRRADGAGGSPPLGADGHVLGYFAAQPVEPITPSTKKSIPSMDPSSMVSPAATTRWPS